MSRVLIASASGCIAISLALPLGACAQVAQQHEPATRPATEARATTLSLGDLTVLVHAPATHYRGRRFDWSGMIGRATFGGRVVWDEWNKDENADNHDANAVGPAMEFGIERPVGYDEAAPGGAFVKIGVGLLRRETDKPYFFGHAYAFAADPPPWVERSGPTWYEASQNFASDLGYAYSYRKTIQLKDNALMLQCELTNTGSRRIETDVYAHNFFRLGGHGWRLGTKVDFDGPVKVAEGRKLPDMLTFDQATAAFVVSQALKPGRACWVPLSASPDASAELPRTFRLSNDDGLAIQASIDRAPSKYVIFGLENVVCVEPFIELRLAPGERAEWTYRYEFSDSTKGRARD
jgi:hypothetical protein